MAYFEIVANVNIRKISKRHTELRYEDQLSHSRFITSSVKISWLGDLGQFPEGKGSYRGDSVVCPNSYRFLRDFNRQLFPGESAHEQHNAHIDRDIGKPFKEVDDRKVQFINYLRRRGRFPQHLATHDEIPHTRATPTPRKGDRRKTEQRRDICCTLRPVKSRKTSVFEQFSDFHERIQPCLANRC